MEYVGGVHQHLLTIHSLENHSRVSKLAKRTLQCFRVLDLGYFVTGLALTVSAADYDLASHTEKILFGGSLLLFSGLSALCNLLALRGTKTGIRRYIIPWLLFYPWVMILLVFGVFHTLWITDFHIELYQVFILLIVSGIFTCWKHVYRMFKLLGSLAQQDSSPPGMQYPEYGSMSGRASSEDQDHPPKYEDVEQFPPQYEMPPDYEEAVGRCDTDKLIEN